MEKRTILITGGSSGIGDACVKAALAAGYDVHFTYRSGRPDDLVALGATGHPLDQGDPASIDALVEATGRVDVLVNNAGLGTATVERYIEGRREQDLALLRVNAAGVLWLSEAYLPLIRQGGGSIINIASVGGGVTQFPGFRLADGMSKAAVAFLTKQMAAETAHEPVSIHALCPGATDTPMFAASTLDAMSSDERTAFEAGLPKGRMITPAEVADMVLWLAEGRPMLHGAVIDASMGLGVRPGLVSDA